MISKNLFSPICDRVIEFGLILLVITTPLALGTVHVRAYTLMELVVLLLLFVWVLKVTAAYVFTPLAGKSFFQRQSPLRLPLITTPLNIALLLFLGLILFQLIPLPSSTIKVLSPSTYNLYQETLPGWPQATAYESILPDAIDGEAAHPRSATHPLTTTWRPISIYSHETTAELLKFFTYSVVFFLLINTVRTMIQLRRLILAVVVTGVAASFIALLQLLSGTDKIYWFWLSPYKVGDYFGPFVNPNHFAGYLEMVIPLAMGLLIAQFSTGKRIPAGNWRRRLSLIEAHLAKNALLIFGIVLMSASLFFSLSRGGIVTFLFSLVFFFCALGFKRTQKRKRKVVLVIFGLVFMVLIWLGIGPILRELSTLLNLRTAAAQRPLVWKDTWVLINDFPLFGLGLGNFQYLYPRYKTIVSQAFWDHAHNDYLELLADAGWVGGIVLGGGLVWFLASIALKWHRRRNPFAVGIGLGGGAGILSLLAHNIVEFNFHLPANALLFFVICGLAVVAVHFQGDQEKDPIALPVRTITLTPAASLITLALTVFLIGTLAVVMVKTCRSDRYFQRAKRVSTQELAVEITAANDSMAAIELRKAISLDPTNARYHYELGRHYVGMMSATWKQGAWVMEKGRWVFRAGEPTVEYACESLGAFSRAVRLAPSNAWYHFNLGWVLMQLGELSEDTMAVTERVMGTPSQLSADSEIEFRRALSLDPTNTHIQQIIDKERVR